MWCHRQPCHPKMCICSNKYLPWGANNLCWADTIDELQRCDQRAVDYIQQKALKNRHKSWKIKIHYSTEVITSSYTFNTTFSCPGMILQQAVKGKRLKNKSLPFETEFNTVKCHASCTWPRHFSVKHSQTE